MYNHIIFQNGDGIAVMGLDYFNRSDIRVWTRAGKLLKNGKPPDPIFTEPDGTQHTLGNGGLQCPADDLLFADGTPVCTESTADFLARTIARHIPAGTVYEVIDTRVYSFPSDRSFRDAWKQGSGQIDVDMPKARVLHMDAIRASRNAELAAKDIPWMKAVEAGDTSAQSTIATEKQVLRDLPATFDITTDVGTPELLKAKWPTELPARE